MGFSWHVALQGNLSERARHRAAEIACDADLRTRAPKGFLPANGEKSLDFTNTPTATALGQSLRLNSNFHPVEPLTRFEAAKQKAGGNRFVDELDFHEVHEALKGHESWCQFLLAKQVSKSQYDKHFSFTTLRNDVMHGRTIFPTYERFKKRRRTVEKMVQWIDFLYAYRSKQSQAS